MPSRSAIPLAALLALQLLACTDATAPSSDLPLVSTVAPEFELEIVNGVGLRTTIVATFTNRTRYPVYIDSCRPLALEVRHPGTSDWVSGFNPPVACGYSPGRRLASGDSRTDELYVHGCLDGTCSPNFELVDGGEYRVVYSAGRDDDYNEPLP